MKFNPSTTQGWLVRWAFGICAVSPTIAVPVNTVASVFIPTTNPATVLANNKAIKTNPAISVKEFKEGYLQVEIGSGVYQFTSQN